MKAFECKLPPNCDNYRPYSFADAFYIIYKGKISAKNAAKSALENGPKWIGHLMNIRNFIVSPFGLVHDKASFPSETNFIGMFPIEYENENKIILGFDDAHLNFRIVIDVEYKDGFSKIIASTYVKTHNLLGKSYLFIIKPFHKIIVASSLERLNSHIG